FSSRRRHTRFDCDWSSDVCSSDLVPFDERGMRDAARRIRAAGLTSVAIASVFSPLNAECEARAAAILLEEHPGAAVTLSHQLGRSEERRVGKEGGCWWCREGVPMD